MLDALAGQGGLSISDIADAIGVDQPRASRLVNESVEHGLVRRSADQADGRRSIVELSPAGRKVLEGAHENRRSAVTRAVSEFTPEETETFAKLLERFVAGWPRD
jgi:DNA-binding MarR family transcriptional regulator